MIPIINAERTGDIIRDKMINAGMKVKDLQRECGLSSSQSVYYWFYGRNVPTIDNLIILSSLFGCKIDDLLAIKYV